MLGNRFDRHGLTIAPAIGESNSRRGTMTERSTQGRVEEFIFSVDELRMVGVGETDGVFRSTVGGEGEFEWTVGSKTIGDSQRRRPKVIGSRFRRRGIAQQRDLFYC